MVSSNKEEAPMSPTVSSYSRSYNWIELGFDQALHFILTKILSGFLWSRVKQDTSHGKF
jgi:hypothetical protein